MTLKPIGLYREQGTPAGASYAEVGQKGLSMSVTEARYRQDGYERAYELLPTKAEYVATLKTRRSAAKPVRWRTP